MRIPGKKRLLLAAGTAATLGAVATLVSGVTFGLFSSQDQSGQSTFSAGTVTVSNDASSVPCAASNLVPGDTSVTNVAPDVPCTFVINDASTVPAYAAVDVLIATAKGTPGVAYTQTTAPTAADLYDTTAAGLQVTISDGTNTFTVPTSTVTCPVSGPFASAVTVQTPHADTCYEVNDLLLSTSAVGPNASPAAISTLTVTWNLPSTSGNAYEGGNATIAMNAHEVQSAHNTLPGACTTVGAACPASGGFQWTS